MKIVCIVLALVMLVAAPLTLWSAEDGAALYKSKNCGACHGEKGEGKAAMKMPAVKGTALTAEQIVTYITKGEAGKKAPHASPVSGVTEEQAKAMADFVKALK
jgi:mono/diheme cytochrome c family protein